MIEATAVSLKTRSSRRLDKGLMPYKMADSFQTLCYHLHKVYLPLTTKISEKKLQVTHDASQYECLTDVPRVDWVCTKFLSAFLGGPLSFPYASSYWGLKEQKTAESQILDKWFLSNNETNPDFRDKLCQLKEYNQIDARITGTLAIKLLSKALKFMSEDSLLRELNYLQDTIKINLTHIGLDTEKLDRFIDTRDKLLKAKEEEFYSEYKINPRSDRQVFQWSKNSGLTVTELNKHYLYSIWDKMDETHKDFFTKRAELQANSLKKMDALKEHSYNGAVYPNLTHFGTKTGRSITEGINLQNFPRYKMENRINTLEGLKDRLRSLIIPMAPQRNIITVDYKQIEFRITLWRLKYFDILEKLDDGLDIYEEFGKKVFNTSFINRQQREICKQWALSLCYGVGTKAMALMAGDPSYVKTAKRAKKIITEIIPRVENLKDKLGSNVLENVTEKHIKVELPNGAVRILDASELQFDKKGNFKEKSQIGARLLAIYNQSTVRELIYEKRHTLLKHDHKILFDMHDALVFETLEDKIQEIQSIMEEPVIWLPNLKLKTSVTSNETWV